MHISQNPDRIKPCDERCGGSGPCAMEFEADDPQQARAAFCAGPRGSFDSDDFAGHCPNKYSERAKDIAEAFQERRTSGQWPNGKPLLEQANDLVEGERVLLGEIAKIGRSLRDGDKR